MQVALYKTADRRVKAWNFHTIGKAILPSPAYEPKRTRSDEEEAQY